MEPQALWYYLPPPIDARPVPGSSKKFLDKSRSLNVDCVAYDLEDSVTPARKVEARTNLRQFLNQPRPLGIREQAVRINAVESGLALDDLTEVVRRDQKDITSVEALLTMLEHSCKPRMWMPLSSQRLIRLPTSTSLQMSYAISFPEDILPLLSLNP